ncbi:MAG: ABC transporter permease [Chloroflexota bacterium]|nr:ABC transporter permease [Chloroflexota bacterium]
MRIRRVARDALPVLAGAAIFLAAWKLVVLLGNFQTFVLPAPEVVATRLLRAWTDGMIEPHVATTLLEIALGFIVGAGLALPVGYLLARSRLAERVISPYLVAAQATPILALAPLIALWFGTGLASKVIICALIVFFPVAVATMVGIRSVDGELLEMGRAFRASRAQVITLLEIPGALPSIFGGIRVGATLAVIGAIIGEWAGGETGLGVLINLARGSLFDTPLLFATLVTIAAVGVSFYLVIILAERRLVGDRG